MHRQFYFWFSTLVCLACVAIAPAAQSAERIDLTYGPFEFSVAVEDLEQFTQTGAIAPDLEFILNRFSPERQAQVRGLLRLRHSIDPAILSRVTYTITGERLIRRLGDLVQTQDGQNGFYGIRGAVVTAAADPGGLSLINVLRKFPTDIRINVTHVLQFVGQLRTTIQETDALVAALNRQTAEAQSMDMQALDDLRQPGDLTVTMRTLTLRDEQRQRTFYSDLYRPDTPEPLPLIMVSGGLGGERDHFANLAQHLASRGFAVAILDHPGSNAQRQRNFFKGLDDENFDSEDFIDRPLDVSFLLNELEKRNASEFNDQLNLEQVGMFGYSLGGTAALALAGAQIDFEQLQQDCSPDEINVINIAVLYQCRALELTRKNYRLKDDRIQAVFLYVPSSRHIYGFKGIESVRVPIFWQATNEDIVTPLLLEQAPMFNALPSPNKYLVVSQGLPHTRVILGLLDRVTGSDRAQIADQLFKVTQDYLMTFNTAFFKTYLSRDKSYQPYLTPAFARSFAQQPYNLSLVKVLPPSDLARH